MEEYYGRFAGVDAAESDLGFHLLVFLAMEREARDTERDVGGEVRDEEAQAHNLAWGDEEGRSGDESRPPTLQSYKQWCVANSMNQKRLAQARALCSSLVASLARSGQLKPTAWADLLKKNSTREAESAARWVAACLQDLLPVLEAVFENQFYTHVPARPASSRGGGRRGGRGGAGRGGRERISLKYQHAPISAEARAAATALGQGTTCLLSTRKCHVPSLAQRPPKALVSLSRHLVHVDATRVVCYLQDTIAASRSWFPTQPSKTQAKNRNKQTNQSTKAPKSKKLSLNLADDY